MIGYESPVTATGGGGGSVNFSAGTTSNNLASVVFSNSNGVSFGLNGSTITASAAGGGGLTNINVSAGTTSQNLSNVVFSNSNNVSFGLNGSTITATATVATSLTAVNLSAGTTSNNLSAFVFSNSNNVSFGLNGSTVTGTVTVATSLSNIRVSAGTTSNLLSALTFANANGISFGLDSSTITGSHNALTSQSNQALSGSNGSFAFQTATFGNLNGLSFYSSNGSLVGSYTVPVQSVESQSIGMNTSTAGGATGGTSGYASGGQVRYDFYAGSNITLSQSVNGASGSMSVYAPTPGAAAENTISFWNNLGLVGWTDTQNVAAKSHADMFLQIFPLDPSDRHFPGRITGNTIYLNFSQSGSSATLSQTHSTRVSLGIYTRNNGSQLSLLNSASTVYGVSVATTNGSTVAQGQRFLSFHSSQWSAQPVFSQGIVYYGALWVRSSNVSAQSLTVLGGFPYSTASRSGTIGVNSASATSRGFSPFLGVYSVTFSTAMPTAIAMSEINKNSARANFVPHMVINALTAVF